MQNLPFSLSFATSCPARLATDGFSHWQLHGRGKAGSKPYVLFKPWFPKTLEATPEGILLRMIRKALILSSLGQVLRTISHVYSCLLHQQR